MKKIIFAVTVLFYCLLVSISSQAQESIKVPQPVQASFIDHFKTSDYQRWVAVKDAFVVTFKQDGKWRDAYFMADGEYKGLGKYITTDLLPVFVQQTISSNYPNYEISELYQYECMTNGLSYFAVLKNDKHKLTLQITPYGDVTMSKKSKIGENKISTAAMAANQ